MAVGVVSSAIGLTYTNYLKEVSETLNQEAKGRLLCKQEKKWSGSHLEWRVHVSRSNAVGPQSDGSQFPTPSSQGYQPLKAYRRITAGKIQITDGAMAACRGSEAAAKDVIVSETEGLMKDLLKYDNFMFFRNGDGIIAKVKSAISTTNMYVDDARALTEGTKFDNYDSSGSSGTFRGSRTVSRVTEAPSSTGSTGYATVVIDSTISGNTTDDTILWSGATSSNCITGLKSLISYNESSFQALNCQTYPKYASLVSGNSGTARELTPNLLRLVLAGLKQKAGAEAPVGITALASNWDAISLEEMYEGDQRLTPSDKLVGIAVSSFQSSMGRVDLVTDADMLLGSMFLADFDQIFHGVQKPLEWRRGDGGQIFQRNDESAVWTATCMEIGDYFIKERRSSARIDDLSFSRVSVY